MNHEFKPPQDDEEFAKMSSPISTNNARVLLRSLTQRRATMVKTIDAEIAFYQRIVDEREKEAE